MRGRLILPEPVAQALALVVAELPLITAGMVAFAHGKGECGSGRAARGQGGGGTRRTQGRGAGQGAEVKGRHALDVASLADFGLRAGAALHLLPLCGTVRAVLQGILTQGAVPGDAQIHVVVVIVVGRKLALPGRNGSDKRKGTADVGIALRGQSLLNQVPAAGRPQLLRACCAVQQAEEEGVLFSLLVPRRDHLKGRGVYAAQADVEIFRPALVVGLAAKLDLGVDGGGIARHDVAKVNGGHGGYPAGCRHRLYGQDEQQ